jgi:alkylation response protein AidB-like acyl-CoA dehydrogenase
MMSSIEDRIAPVVETAAANAAAVDHDAAFPEQTVKALADAGLLGNTLPAEVGGLGLGPPSS